MIGAVIEQGTTYIRQLRACSPDRDTLAAELRLSHLLSSADLRPASLPGAAILCVRALRVPGPMEQRFAAIGSGFERRVNSLLDELARQAARPAHGSVPANAQAVVFHDRAELLACLARDWCEGSLAARWWWPSLLRAPDLSAAVAPTWLAAPQYAPAALQQLARSSEVVAFARRLDRLEGRRLLASIIRAFGLSELSAALSDIGDDPASVGGDIPRPHPVAPAAVREVEAPSHDEHRRDPVLPPWEPWTPEIAAAPLLPIQAAWLGTGLTLARAPSAPRSLAFAVAARQWLMQAVPPPMSPSASARLTMQPADTVELPDAIEPIASARSHAIPLPPTADRADDQSPLPRNESPPLGQTRPEVVQPRLPAPPPAVARPLPHAPRLPVEAEIETEFGGLFYLINLGLFLELYGDFTRPLHPGLALPIWDFIAQLGARLLNAPLDHDPIMPLLARLSGHAPDTAPSHDFTPPDRWQIPAAWLAPFPKSDGWRCSIVDGRLQIAHPAGFLVADVPCDNAGEKQALSAAYGVEGIASTGVSWPHAATPRDRWLDWLVPYVVARLQRALGLDEGIAPGPILCAHHAQVRVTATHCDVHFALADLPIAVRLSGLDRDPGWVPAAGRFVAFHFA